MIPKSGKDVLDPTNHRQRSLLIPDLLVRLKNYTLNHTRSEKFGFRSNHCITTELLSVIDDIVQKKNLRQKTAAVPLDVNKTFDRV